MPPPTQPGDLGAWHSGMRPHRGGLILGLGITSLALPFVTTIGSLIVPFCSCAGILSLGCAIAAWIMGSSDLNAMQTRQMDPSGRGQTSAGRTCAIISVALHAAGLLLLILFMIIFGIAAFGMAAGAAGSGGSGGTP
jgi:hypothetical protein